ncbi:hypothetical protein BH11VER1_BH11VER1_12770 [soil metagenome]
MPLKTPGKRRDKYSIQPENYMYYLSKKAATSIPVAVTFGWLLFLVSPAEAQSEGAKLGKTSLERIGKRIWQNECAGTVEGLTSWNSGENFASLGIGHFIWYPAGTEGPFEESFPKLVAWMNERGVAVPGWLLKATDCPWKNREAFLSDQSSDRQKQLRSWLAGTVAPQTQFIIARLDAATPKFRSAAGKLGPRVEQNVTLLRQTAAGNFAMIDYVNFKGEGLNPKERYNDQGWGLLQVLMDMPSGDAAAAPAAFAESAKRVLTQRVRNSPPDRKEQRWLPGWSNRCDSYRQD